MSYIVTIRYKNGQEVIFEADNDNIPLLLPTPITETTSIPNPLSNSPSIYPTYTSSSRQVHNIVPMFQRWAGQKRNVLLINVYEILDITIEGDDD